MRPRRGTEAHGRGVFLTFVAIGAFCVVGNLVRIVMSPDTLGVISSVAAIVVGSFAVWRGGYMLEWWGAPEPR